MLVACGSDEAGSVQENVTDDPVPPVASSCVLYTYSFDSAVDHANPEGPGGSAELYATKVKKLRLTMRQVPGIIIHFYAYSFLTMANKMMLAFVFSLIS